MFCISPRQLGFVFLLSLAVVSCGGGGGDKPSNSVVANKAPTVNAGTDQTVNENTQITLTGTGTDSDGSISTYKWIQSSGTSVEIPDTQTASITFTTPVIETNETLTFQLTVTDDDGATASDSLSISVVNVNQLPVVNAGTDQTINENTQITLTGSGTDSDGSISSYKWIQSSGTSVEIPDTQTASITFTTPVIETNETLIFQLTVTDDDGATASDSLSISVVNVNQQPIANAGTDRTVDENIQITLTGSGTDSDGSISNYQWTQTDGINVNLTGANSSQVTFVTPNVAQDESLTFELSITDDGGLISSDKITITVVSPEWMYDAEAKWGIPLEQLDKTCIIENVECKWLDNDEELHIILHGKGFSTDADNTLTFSITQERLDTMRLEPSSSYSFVDLKGLTFTLGEGNFSSWYECLNENCSITNRKNALLDAIVTEDGFTSEGIFIDTRADYSDRLTMNGLYNISYFINGPNYYIGGDYIGSMHSRFFSEEYYREVYNTFRHVYGYASEDSSSE